MPFKLSLPDFLKVVVAAAAIAVAAAIHPIVKIVKTVIYAWHPEAVAFDNRIDRAVSGAYNSLVNQFDSSAHPVTAAIADQTASLGPFITNTHNVIAYQDGRIDRALSGVKGVASNPPKALNPSKTTAELDKLTHRVSAVAAVANTNRRNEEALKAYVQGPYLAMVESKIAWAAGHASSAANSYTTTAVRSQEDTYRRARERLGVLPLDTVIPGDISIAQTLAYVVGITETMAQDATTCWNPMCSWWNQLLNLGGDITALVTESSLLVLLAEIMRGKTPAAASFEGIVDPIESLGRAVINAVSKL